MSLLPAPPRLDEGVTRDAELPEKSHCTTPIVDSRAQRRFEIKESDLQQMIYPVVEAGLIEKGYASYTGPREENEAWQRRARGWIRAPVGSASSSINY